MIVNPVSWPSVRLYTYLKSLLNGKLSLRSLSGDFDLDLGGVNRNVISSFRHPVLKLSIHFTKDDDELRTFSVILVTGISGDVFFSLR